MLIILHETKDSNNTINKTLGVGKEYDIVFKDDADIQNPIIMLQSNTNLINFNYCYIPNFNRYYFITNVVIETNNIYRINLRCDVLESFKDEILTSEGVISKHENGNEFYDGGDYETEVRKEVDKYDSDTKVSFEQNKIMIVVR